MSHFGQKYAEWYDAMYQDKTYDQEVDCIRAWLEKYGNGGKSLACIGAGTLNHETLLSVAGYEIFGIDQSEAMVQLAKNKISTKKLSGITVQVGDMRDFSFQTEKFDAALIMFNVIGYCANENELIQVFTNARKGLKNNGILIFDAWYDEAIKNSPPFDRWRKTTYQDLQLYRLTHQEHKIETQQIMLDIEVLALKGNELVDRTEEIHFVRYWSLEEVTRAAQASGFEVVYTATFPGNQTLTKDDWSFGAVLKRI